MADKDKKRRRRVKRHLNYAWIEFGSKADARGFAAGAKRAGFHNMLLKLSTTGKGRSRRWIDTSHPLLPIRRSGKLAVLALPNTVRDTDGSPPVKDKLFERYKALHSLEEFKKEFAKEIKSLADWTLSPGITHGGGLVSDSGADDFADLLFLSGHQSGGRIYGGDSSVGLNFLAALKRGASTPTTNKLRYIVIPACGACGGSTSAPALLPLFRRANPIHGILGYSGTYTGGSRGFDIQKRFARNLTRRMTILEAWRRAQDRRHENEWGAIMHQSAISDTVRDWIAGTLKSPGTNNPVVVLNQDNFSSGGVEVKPPLHDQNVFFVVDGKKIDETNNDDPTVGLFSGDKGHIDITKRFQSFGRGDEITLMFVYIRVGKELEIDKLLKIKDGSTAEATITLKSNLNRNNKTTGTDGFTVTFKKRVKTLKVPFEVLANAHTTKPVKLQGTGDFGTLSLRVSDDAVFALDTYFSSDEDHQVHAATLRGPRPSP